MDATVNVVNADSGARVGCDQKWLADFVPNEEMLLFFVDIDDVQHEFNLFSSLSAD